jgi:hypothetical protein
MRRAALLTLFCLGLRSAPFPTPVAELDLDKALQPATKATLAFISDQEIVIARSAGSSGMKYSATMAFHWSGAKLRMLASKELGPDSPLLQGEVFAAAHGGVLLRSLRQSELLTADLKSQTALPVRMIVPPADHGDIVAANERTNYWKLYRLTPQFTMIREGEGRVLSVSDDVVFYRGEKEIRVEKIQGGLVGSFQVPPESLRVTPKTTPADLKSTCVIWATILTSGRLFLKGCGPDRVVDFNGTELLRIPNPDGWDARQGFSAGGTRVLFDNFTRRISALQRSAESVESALTRGLAPVEESKGEMMAIINLTTP